MVVVRRGDRDETLEGVELESLGVCVLHFTPVSTFRAAHARRHRTNNSAEILISRANYVGVNSEIEFDRTRGGGGGGGGGGAPNSPTLTGSTRSSTPSELDQSESSEDAYRALSLLQRSVPESLEEELDNSRFRFSHKI